MGKTLQPIEKNGGSPLGLCKGERQHSSAVCGLAKFGGCCIGGPSASRKWGNYSPRPDQSRRVSRSGWPDSRAVGNLSLLRLCRALERRRADVGLPVPRFAI